MATGWLEFDRNRRSAPDAGRYTFFEDGAQVVRPEVAEAELRARDAQMWAQRARPESPPPLPPSAPMVGPVAGLKQQVARDFQPEAARILYQDTPVKMYHGVEKPADPQWVPGSGGSYWAKEYGDDLQTGYPYEIMTGYMPSTLRHEFAHKWYGTQMPPGVKEDWERDYEYVNPVGTKNFRDIQGGSPNMYDSPYNPNEVYAYSIMDYPAYSMMDDTVRNKYYAGLFQGDQRTWDDPYAPQTRMQSFSPPPSYEPPSLNRVPPWMTPGRIRDYLGNQG